MNWTRIILTITCVAALSACGADGEPVQPTMGATVGIGSGGAYVAGGVGVAQGPFALFFGF